jgi:hypothetical protein
VILACIRPVGREKWRWGNPSLKLEHAFRQSTAAQPPWAQRLDHGEVRRRHGRGLGWGHEQRRRLVPEKGTSDSTAAACASVTSSEVASAPVRVAKYMV